MKTNRLFVLVLLFTSAILSYSQMPKPVKMASSLRTLSSTSAELNFLATIDEGWHLYSTNVIENGPNPTVLVIDHISGAELDGSLVAKGNVIKNFDPMFEADLYYFEKKAQFVQKLKLKGGAYKVEGCIEYSSCNDRQCMPPSRQEFSFSGEAPADAAVAADADDAKASEDTVAEVESDTSAVSVADSSVAKVVDTDLWKPVVDQLNAFEAGGANDVSSSSLWKIFLLGLLGGFVALLTPCVWPIIPMTVSFFLHRSSDKHKGVKDAILYGVSIVIIYVALGLLVTTILGANALNSMATNAVFNIFFFVLLVVFAISFFGAFELTLPSSWSNAVDGKAEKTGGLLGIFLMAFTLTLVSFSCTGPIIGFLLVEVSSSGNILSPAIGMLGFAVALALPFTLFAMFPSWLKQMPKSGGWMNCVKVVLGFIELAFALKFFSVADLAYGWHLLDRETFLALWIALFFLLGLYLLGKIKFTHDDDSSKVGVVRFMLALASISFSIYMLPGLWGAPLKAVSAFTPPMNTQDFNLYDSEVKPDFTDYEKGMAYAAANGKPVMIDFSGYGCVNCRKMEAAVWTDPTVSSIINDDYVLIQLFVDDKTPLPEIVEVEENGATTRLRTVGDKWSYLQRSKFGANAQPFYVLIDEAGNPLHNSYSYDENIDKYVEFLKKGAENYRNK